MATAPTSLEEIFGLDPARIEAVLLRYSGAGPRYTSYPTAPVWNDAFDPARFRDELASREPGEPAALYAHVPFCRSLCHFCACNRVITRQAEPVARYLDDLEREVALLREALPGDAPVVQHHWGGGTPTHLAPDQIRRLHHALDDAFPAVRDAEVSIEVDPRVTTEAHVEALRDCGFNRVSMGVQDFEPRVQQAIHREQSVEATAALVAHCREAGFTSVGFDLIYGLPFQDIASMERTLDRVVAIAPDRIALYAYAHVTWVAKQQRGFERHDLPAPEDRIRIQLAAIRRLLAAGYVHVGMDHFARPEDELARAAASHRLRRNFMGYTTQPDLDLLGVGPSAISELATAYAQSQRGIEAWSEAVGAGRLPTLRGHALSDDDRLRKWVIAEIMCHGALDAKTLGERFDCNASERFATEIAALTPLAEDGLVAIDADGSVRVLPLGRLVVRNVAMVFDAYLEGQQTGSKPIFSQTV